MSKLWKWSSIGQGRSVIALLLALVLLLSPFSMIQVKAAATAPTKVTIVGNLQPALVPGANEWDPATEATVMEDKGNGLYQFTGTLPAGNYEYKIALNGTWDISYGNANYTKPGKPAGDNIQLTLAEETEVTFYYNHNSKQIADSTYYTPIEADKQPRIVGNVQPALGEANEWNPATATHFLTDDNFDNVYTLTAEVPAGSYEFKVVLGDNWDGAAAYPANNYTFSLEEAQSVTFTYNADTDEVTADASIERNLRVHYKRAGGDYENMGLWLWGDVATPSQAPPEEAFPVGATEFLASQMDSYGAYVDIPLNTNPKQVGFVVVNTETEEKDGNDKIVVFSSPELNEVWIEQGSDNVLTYEPAEIPENTVRIHYNRADGNYEKLGLWIWEDVQVPSATWPTSATSFVESQVDRYGAYLDIPLIEAAKKIGFLVVNKDTQVKDGDNKEFALLEQYNRLWIFEGDNNVYISPYKEVPVGIVAAEVVAPQKLWLSFTVTAGLDAEEVKSTLTITDKDGADLNINKVTILNSKTIEVEAEINLDKLPLSVTYDGKTVSAAAAWRLIDNLYAYEGDDLGATYKNGDVTFKLWSPLAEAVTVNLYDKDNAADLLGEFELQLGENGVWSLQLTAAEADVADLDGYYYQYQVTNDGATKPVLDPYAKSMAPFTVNTENEAGPDGDVTGKAAIVDLSKTDPADFTFADIEGYEKREDAVIWEAHIRDFTSDPSIEGDLNARWGSYAAFADKLDYIKSLGVTHVQLLPVMAWYYGDETNMNERELDYSAQNNEYNWGYDPHNYFSPDGAYSEDPADAALRVKELKELIAAIHDAGMGVILDVVYTHMAKADFLNDIVPGYYFFKDEKGNFVGDFGNNLATSHAMSEKLMVDSVKYWFEEYKIDGMRWDMMGDATYDSVQHAYDEAAAINPNALFIGEGWDTFKGNRGEPELAGKGATQAWMDKTDDVGVFSDEIRNQLKSGYPNEGQPSFITGGARDITTIFNNIKGQPSNTPADAPGDMVQYIEAHDNLTLHDVIAQSIQKDPTVAADELEIHKRLRIGNLLILTSQGTAFLHAGQEYGRTKQWLAPGVPEQKYTLVNYDSGESGYFIHDSYDSSDAINKFDWQKATDADQYPINAVTKDYTAGLIELRKSTEAFRLGDAALVDSNVALLPNTGIAATDLAIAYKAKSTDGSGEYYMLVNADDETRTINLATDLTGGTVVVDNDEAGVTAVSEQSGFTLTANSITLEPLTAVVIRMESAQSQLESVALDSESEKLQIGSKQQLKAYALYNDGARRTVTGQATYASDNEDVATVDSKGLITAVAEGTATITVTYQGKTASTTIEVTKEVVQRIVQIHYVRPDKDYTDWNMWVWGTGVQDDQINFSRVENGVAIVDLEVSPTATYVGFVLRKGTDWDTAKQDYPDDRIIPLEPGSEVTKVYITSMVPEIVIIPQVSGPVLDNGGVTFYYRDNTVFRTGNTDSVDSVKVSIGGKEYEMVYDEQNAWYSYRLNSLTVGTHQYKFLITKDGVTEEHNDPRNTVNGKSVIVYEKPSSTIKASVQPATIAANTNAVVKVEASLANQSSFTKAFLDLSALGGPDKVPFDMELMEQTIAVKDTVTAGNKKVVITFIDEFGNHHKQNVTVRVTAKISVGELDFDWDEARIYFALTDRFADGDATNNANVDKAHPEAYHGGDFRGMIDKLDYLQELGINTLWITPIVDNIDFNKGVDFADTQYGYHGYWAKNFEKLDEHLGDLATFKELINAAHDRGIKIMVDVVLNHAGYGLKEADNYPGVTAEDKQRFAGMLRTDGVSANDDPIHGELASLPDFKTEDPDVRAKLIEWQTSWLERAQTDRGDTIDYFRVDTVKHVEETTWKAFKNELTKLKPDFKLVGEYFGASADLDGGTLRSGQMDGLLDFSFKERAKLFANGSIDAVDDYLAKRELKIDNTATMAQFLSSHDENGFLSEYVGGDKGKLKVAAALQITAKGQPVIYYGEELGQSGKTSGDLANGEYSENRDDMPWNLLDKVKETDTEEQAAAKVEAQALHQHYTKLLNIRDKFSKVYAKGERTKLAGSDELGYLAFNKHYKGTDVVTIINTKTDAVSVELSVPFLAGTVATDEYSGATYKVSADRKVVVAVAGRNDGGTVVLSGVSKSVPVDVPVENNNGQPGDVQSISADELAKAAANSQNGVVNVPVAGGKQAVELSVQDLKALGDNALKLTGDGVALTLPNSKLADIQALAADNKLNNANALIGFQKLAEDKKKAALEKLASAKSASGSVQLKPASPIFDISLQLVDQATGNKQAIDPQGITVAFKIDENANPDLLGVYDVNGTYIGGVVDGDQIIVNLQQAGQYVVLEWEKTYNDVPGAHWAANAIEMLSARHVVNGVSDTMFAPNSNITRAEFAAMLVRALDLRVDENAATAFNDVQQNAWYNGYIAAASESGLIKGRSSSEFAPNAVVSREEMAVMIMRAWAAKTGADAAVDSSQTFADQEQISAWAEEAITQATGLGLLNGKTNGKFDPQGSLTRAEGAQALYRFLKK